MYRRVPAIAFGVVFATSLIFVSSGTSIAGEKGHGKHAHKSQQTKGPVTLTGEVVDLMCYLDHGARGKSHRDCAEKCVRQKGPVGLLVEPARDSGSPEKSEQGSHGEHGSHGHHEESHSEKEQADKQEKPGPTVYLIIGQHEPINEKLAPHAAKRITVRGKVVERAGMKMVENVRIVDVGELVGSDEKKE